MGGRGDQTREHLLDVAEQLFGANGVANVSMRQIRIAAQQRNEGAVQYHFGDLNGVISALSERHVPGIQAIQDRIVDAHGSHPTLDDLVDALARPIAEYGTRGPSERAWVKTMAELLSDPQLSFATLQDEVPPSAARVGFAVYEQLCETLKPETAGERVWAVTQFVVHVAADRARIRDDPKAARELSSDQAFIENIVTMAYGALVAQRPEP